MIPNGNKEDWYYFAILRGITPKHDGDFYC